MIKLYAIAGYTASGKSYWAKKMADDLKATLISMDDYYVPVPQQLKDEEGHYIFDLPESFEIDLLKSHLEDLSNNKPIEKPVYLYNKVPNGRADYTETIAPPKDGVVILEGLYTIHSLKDLDIHKVFIDRDINACIETRLKRDLEERNVPIEMNKRILKKLSEYWKEYGSYQKDLADKVIDNNF